MKLLGKISLTCIIIIGVISASSVMDNTIQNFYIQHFHPRIQTGEVKLGKIIVQNNNPNGYSVTVTSQNGGKMVPTETHDGQVYIDYTVKFEQGSGRIGTGITENIDETDMLASHLLLMGTAPTTDTDVALNLIITIENMNSKFMMAGTYRDTIDVNLINN